LVLIVKIFRNNSRPTRQNKAGNIDDKWSHDLYDSSVREHPRSNRLNYKKRESVEINKNFKKDENIEIVPEVRLQK
jgi:hypothetical protein